MKRIDLNDPLIDALLLQIRHAFQTEDIETFDMYDEGVLIGEGPVTLSFYYELVDRTRKTLNSALKLGAVIEQYVAPVLNMPYGEKVRVRISHAGEHVIVEIPHPDPWHPTFEDVQESAERTFWLGYKSTYGELITVDLVGLDTGLLAIGRSGSGKTNAMLWLALQAIEQGWVPALVDLKGGAKWAPLAPWSPWDMATTPQDAKALLKLLAEIMTERNSPGGDPEPPILLVFDELHAAPKKLQEALAHITARGREAMIRTLGGSQRAGDTINKMVRTNLSNRLCGYVPSDEAYNAVGFGNSGVDELLGHGDMLWTIDTTPPGIRVKIPQVLDRDGLLPSAREWLAGMPKVGADPFPQIVSENGAEPTQEVIRRRRVGGPSQSAHVPKGEATGRAGRSAVPALRGLFEKTYMRLKRESEKGNCRRTPPPRWMIARSIAHIDRGRGTPKFAQLLRWHVARTGKQISQRRRRVCREVAEELVSRREEAA